MRIATSKTAKSKVWRNTETSWDKFAQMLETPKVMPFTLKEYLAKPKAEQATLKDVGGYVGGYLKDGSRKIDKVQTRHLVTLDIDNNPQSDLLDKLEALGIAAVIHSTFKSTSGKPRYRIIAPLDAPVSPAQYQAIARRIADTLGIEQFDPTTFEPHRLMYWPAKPSDTDYIFERIEGAPINTEKTLATYLDWSDTSEWPMHESAKERVQTKIKKLEDPTTKHGIVGAFCKTYDIHEAIAEYLSEVYAPTADPNRYTYTAGETAAGLIVYDDLWAYSHHGTDPISGRECNAFDLVRVHLFGELDKDEAPDKGITSLPSYKAMQQRASEDGNVKNLLLEQRSVTSDDFGVEEQPTTDTQSEEFDEDEYNREWRARLTYKPKSTQVEPNIENAQLIFDYDLRLKGCFKWDKLSDMPSKTTPLPWDKRNHPRAIEDTDWSQLRGFFSRYYGFKGDKDIVDALVISAMGKPFHPLRDYLDTLEWDGTPRVDTLLIDKFATLDTKFTRAAIRKTLCAAIARAYEPGIKFDYMLVLSGGQAAGKSTFVERLCYKNSEWFTDNFGYSSKENKMSEQIRGKWIVEMSEMSGWRKAEVSEMKQFISRKKDEYRGAYAKEMTRTPRQCIFIASTNENEFLYDPTGDRRYWPITVNKRGIKNWSWDMTNDEVDQIWAEAKHLYEAGEKLYLSPEEEAEAKEAQETYTVRDTKLGQVDIYLETPIAAKDWYRKELIDRRQWFEERSNPDNEWTDSTIETKQRDTVCIAEIWCECFKRPKEDMNKSNTREINDMMRAHPRWEYIAKPARFGDYGVQRYYKRTTIKEQEDEL